MKRWIVFNPRTSLYLPEVGNTGSDLEGAKIFPKAATAKKAASKWDGAAVLREVQLAPTNRPLPSTTPDMQGVFPIPFKMVVDYFREVYFTDLTKAMGVASRNIYNVPLLPFLEAHNKFLRTMGNGDQMIVKMSDFEQAHPALLPHARELMEAFGVTDDEGNTFCLFLIDWKDAAGGMRSDY